MDNRTRDDLVLWKSPITTSVYFIAELFCLVGELLSSLRRHYRAMVALSVPLILFTMAYFIPGSHQNYVSAIETKLLWWSWWIFLGILSSVGLGSGLHTFMLYLGPHIVAVTLAAYECSSLDFPEPPYPESILCPSAERHQSISIWMVMSKVRVESMLWGLGTAIGELPPYLMARAARLSGQESEDDEYKEFLEIIDKNDKGNMNLLDRVKLFMEQAADKLGFFGIMACASFPNPLFDLVNISCGHFLVPFWKFFGATMIGKSLVKMHFQMAFVIILFSKHHVEHIIAFFAHLPYGDHLKKIFSEFLDKQKKTLHRSAGGEFEESSTFFGDLMNYAVSLMLLYFIVVLVNSLAQSYHKRIASQPKTKRE